MPEEVIVTLLNHVAIAIAVSTGAGFLGILTLFVLAYSDIRHNRLDASHRELVGRFIKLDERTLAGFKMVGRDVQDHERRIDVQVKRSNDQFSMVRGLQTEVNYLRGASSTNAILRDLTSKHSIESGKLDKLTRIFERNTASGKFVKSPTKLRKSTANRESLAAARSR